MIGVWTILIDSAVKLVPAADFLKQRRSDHVAEIGLPLFDLYRSAISVAENGYAILRKLGVVVRAHREGERTGKPSMQVGYSLDLVKLLNKQSDKLAELIVSFDNLRPMAHLVDKKSGDEFLSLVALLHTKELRMKMGATYLQPARGLSNLHAARNLGAMWLFSEIRTSDRDVGNATSSVGLGPKAEILAALERGRMSVDKVPWDPKLTDLAETYLESGIGARRLEGLVDSATRLRASIQAVFDLDDLLSAHERRLKDFQHDR